MLKKISKTAHIFGLSFCIFSLGAISAYAMQRSLSKAEQNAVAKALETQLLDSFSAKYIWPKVPTENNFKDGAVGYCFKVNAKNEMGGYTGFHIVYGRAVRPKDKIIGFEYRDGLGPTAQDEAAAQSSIAKICQVLGIDVN